MWKISLRAREQNVVLMSRHFLWYLLERSVILILSFSLSLSSPSCSLVFITLPHFSFFFFFLLYSFTGLLIDQSVGKAKMISPAVLGALTFHLQACSIEKKIGFVAKCIIL